MKRKTLSVYRADASSCNGCDIEIVAALAPRYKFEELGVKVVYRPEKASVLLVTGGGNIKIDNDLKAIYEKLQPPKTVIAIGSCAISWEAFEGGYSIVGPADETIPVDFYVCGCPPRPQAILDALAKALKRKRKEGEGFWRAPEGFRGKPELDADKCTACGACEQACPTRAIEIMEKDGSRTVTYLLGKCSYCRTCETACPDDAVELIQEYQLVFQDKKEAVVTAEIKLLRCNECGAFFISPRQIENALKRIVKNAEEYIGFREGIKKAMQLCLNCRMKIPNIRKAKLLLARLTDKALENS